MERLARVVVLGLLLVVGLLAFGGMWFDESARGDVIELRGKLPEDGGWAPETLRARVGEPLRLRITSDDVVHSFAIGQSDFTPVDVMPGEWTDVELIFDRPGRYVFYCTRWCGENHWRMRGTIEVSGPGDAEADFRAAVVRPIGAGPGRAASRWRRAGRRPAGVARRAVGRDAARLRAGSDDVLELTARRSCGHGCVTNRRWRRFRMRTCGTPSRGCGCVSSIRRR